MDFPPGTGSIQLTLRQSVAFSAAVIVTNPQKLLSSQLSQVCNSHASNLFPTKHPVALSCWHRQSHVFKLKTAESNSRKLRPRQAVGRMLCSCSKVQRNALVGCSHIGDFLSCRCLHPAAILSAESRAVINAANAVCCLYILNLCSTSVITQCQSSTCLRLFNSHFPV